MTHHSTSGAPGLSTENLPTANDVEHLHSAGIDVKQFSEASNPTARNEIVAKALGQLEGEPAPRGVIRVGLTHATVQNFGTGPNSPKTTKDQIKLIVENRLVWVVIVPTVNIPHSGPARSSEPSDDTESADGDTALIMDGVTGEFLIGSTL